MSYAYEAQWKQSVDFHGHACAGLAAGYRVARIALDYFGGCRDEDEELVAVVENDSCAVDAIQVVTGCTFGKGNLWFKDYGKNAYTFFSRERKKGLRISVSPKAWIHSREFQEIWQKIASGSASEDDYRRLREIQEANIRHVFKMPEEDFCTKKEVGFNPPERARIFRSLVCSACNEQVSEHRARIMNGLAVCIPCSKHQERRIQEV